MPSCGVVSHSQPKQIVWMSGWVNRGQGGSTEARVGARRMRRASRLAGSSCTGPRSRLWTESHGWEPLRSVSRFWTASGSRSSSIFQNSQSDTAPISWVCFKAVFSLHFCPPGNDIWTHSRLSQLGSGCYWHLVGRSQGCC